MERIIRTTPDRRGVYFEEFLKSIDMADADTVIASLGDGVFTGIGRGEQVCVRSQTVANRLNDIIRGLR